MFYKIPGIFFKLKMINCKYILDFHYIEDTFEFPQLYCCCAIFDDLIRYPVLSGFR